VLRATVFVISFAIFLSILTNCVESSEIKLISPIGAAVRSIVPGWGQFYTRDKLTGSIVFLSIGILASGGIRADAIYRDFYNNRYTPAALAGSSEADSLFDRSNQYYKLSRFLLYTAAGIWAYSALDAYSDAHVYNARQQLKMLDVDDEGLRQLKLMSGSGKADIDFQLRSRASLAFVLAEIREDDTRCPTFQSSVQYPDHLFLSKTILRGD